MNENKVVMKRSRREALFGATLFPLAIAPPIIDKAKQVWGPTILESPVMHYVWIFSWVEDDFIPIGVFNTRKEADKTLEELRKQVPMSNGSTGAVISEKWSEFVSRAAQVRLGPIAQAIEKLGIKI